MPAFIFIDTNLLLHFKRPDQIDWKSLVGGDDVTLVLAEVVVHELDTNKYGDRPNRIRARAKETEKWIEERLSVEGPDCVRSGVGLLYRANPRLPLKPPGLQAEVSDDWLLASALEHQASHRGERVILVSNDLNVRLKAKPLGLEVWKPDAAWRLPEEPDPVEVENRQLKATVAALQARAPRLALTFENGASRVRVALPTVELITEGRIERAVVDARLRAEAERPLLLGDDDDEAGRGYTRRQAVELSVNAQNSAHDYMVRLQAARDHRSRTVTLDLVMSNVGSAPATNIDLVLGLLAATATFAEDASPDPPEPTPGAPRAIPPAPFLLAPTPRIEGARWSLKLDRLKQFDTANHRLFVTFQSRPQAASFGITYEATFDEGMEKSTGRLNVIIEGMTD